MRTDSPAATDLARWQRHLAAVLDGHLHEQIAEVAVDGIALVPSRTVLVAGCSVRVEEGAAVACSCLHDCHTGACVHRMALAVRLWQRELLGAGCPLDGPHGCDPYALPPVALCLVLVARYLSPSPERVRAAKLRRWEAVRRREDEALARTEPRRMAPGTATKRVPLL